MMMILKLLFFLTLCLHSAFGKRQDAIIKTSDPRVIIPVASPFGFSSQGVTTLNFKLIRPTESPKNLTKCARAGFFYTKSSPQLLEELNQIYGQDCIFDDRKYQVLDTVDKLLSRKNEDELGSQQYLYQVEQAGLYSVVYASCDKELCDIDFEIIIMEQSDGTNHLSVGDIPLPVLFVVSASIYLVMLLTWSIVLFRRRESTHKIHYLMALLLVFIMLDSMSQAGMYFRIQITGDTDGWNIAYYVFTFIRGVLFFTVIILISAGWSYMKPFIGGKERKILMVVIPLQIMANVAIVVWDELNVSNISWFSWRNLFYALDVICCCAVLFPIIWQIKHLTQASQKDDKLIRCLNKLLLFRRFYVMVVVWIYFTRFVVYLMMATLPYYLSWLAELANQVAYIFFYLITGYIFRPHTENPYFVLQQQDVDELVLDFEDDQDEHDDNVIGIREIESQGLMAKVKSMSDQNSNGNINGNSVNGNKAKQKKVEMQKVAKD